ncbi:ABC transporter ATP-binding protein [Streptomyces sp. ALI-76-A]|jgi:ABC-2 type transport system ATP-binding protein|uniref:ABC transporter ATP-binding protein n=1 Tax=Streptomyces sp. ALI-76-A TaxID=3025736 RepID=UPI00256F3EAC|nr:ABC transporter ATP-binding protein [Streptomyces sp. ALI-76-A]MDL5206011.1 ABC transporter ATP-binding protein [Streptomyces sp. ALI-76-A]
METTPNVIEVTDLRRRYGAKGTGGFDAVRGVSFRVAQGELFALLGTNGAGKTSTVELLEGLAAPTAGSIRILGHDPYHERKRVRSRTGVMLQQGGFAPDLTVAETLRMWKGCTARPRPITEALAMVGLDHRADVRVKNLSGGEKRRLDLALATLGDPEVLFLDEPTTGMDPQGRRETWEIIRELRGRGTTVVLTTHYLEEAELLADSLAIMNEGLIAASGTVADIVATHPSVLSFRLPPGFDAEDLPSPQSLRATLTGSEGRSVHMSTMDLQFTTTEALVWARDKGIELKELNARSASLEEAFMHIARNGAMETEATRS